MKENKALQKVKTLYNNFKTRMKPRLKMQSSNLKSNFGESHFTAYQLFGERTRRFLPLFEDLDSNLQKSGLKVAFRAYVSLTVFTAIAVSFVMLVLIPISLIALFKIPLFSSMLFGFGGALFTFAFSIIGFYVYPIYRADKFRRNMDDELPFTAGYMAILASAGVSPEKIFYSLSSLSEPLTISLEARDIVRDVNLFGLDIISALEQASKRTPSEKFREMLEGFISTIHSGGNLATFLQEKSRQFMKLKKITLRKFSDTLSILSEFYVALLVTGPLLLVIMLAVMAMLGGGGFGMLNSDILLKILTYIGIPLGSIMFLIILDAASPKW